MTEGVIATTSNTDRETIGHGQCQGSSIDRLIVRVYQLEFKLLEQHRCYRDSLDVRELLAQTNNKEKKNVQKMVKFVAMHVQRRRRKEHTSTRRYQWDKNMNKKNLPGARTEVEGDKPGRRKLISLQPPLRSELFRVWPPDICITTHPPNPPRNLFALVNLDPSREDVVLKDATNILGYTRVETQGFKETGLGVLLSLDGLVGRVPALEDGVDFFAEFCEDFFARLRAVD